MKLVKNWFFWAIIVSGVIIITACDNGKTTLGHAHDWDLWVLIPETEEETATCRNCSEIGERSIYHWFDSSGGSFGNNFRIDTVGQLYGFARIVNGTRANGNEAYDFAGKSVNLIADIDLSQIENWTPIGRRTFGTDAIDLQFSGTFNGNSHIVSNMSIRQRGAGGSGLFGNISNATIRNIGIVDASIIIANGISGGLVGVVTDDSSIENVFVTGYVSSDSQFIGGIVGLFEGNNISIIRSWSTASVSGRSLNGGIVGYVWGSDIVIENNAALNPTITGTEIHTPNRNGRITTGTASFYNNIAWEGMEAIGLPFGDDNSEWFENGESISTVAINADGTLGGRFSETVWTTENGRLPGLGGRTMPMPEHLRQ